MTNAEKVKLDGRTKDGIVTVMLSSQVQSAKRRDMDAPTYTKEWLKGWLFSQQLFHDLFENWVSSDYEKDLKPSIDRKDDLVSYTEDNIQLMTCAENHYKIGNNDKLGIAVVQLTKEFVYVNEFKSAREAERQTGVFNTNIGGCCKQLPNKRSAGGYLWFFKEDYEAIMESI